MYYVHTPGLKVVAPSTAYDAKGMLKSAVRDDNPVLIFEHKLLYGSKGARSEKGSISSVVCERYQELYPQCRKPFAPVR